MSKTSLSESVVENQNVADATDVLAGEKPDSNAGAPGGGLPTFDQVTDEINETYAYMKDVGSVLQEYCDLNTGYTTHRLIPTRQFKSNVANIPFTDNPDEGSRSKQDPGTLWLRSPERREYEAQVFRPEGLTPDENEVYFNTFAGFAFDEKPGDCSLFWAHVHDNIARGDAELTLWLRAWLADLVQHPERHASVAIVLQGERGTGKGSFTKAVGKLLGRHFLHLTNPEVLTGAFNGALENQVFVFADESFWAGDKKAESRLKTLITEDTILVNEKHVPIREVKNVMHLVIAGNDDWVVPTGRHERRFAAFNMSMAQMQNRAYFKAIEDQLDNGGYAALLFELKTFDIEASGVDPHVAPSTSGLFEQQVHSMAPIENFWFGCLEDGLALDFQNQWGESVAGERCIPLKALYRRFADEMTVTQIHRPGDQQSFSIKLKKLLPPRAKYMRKTVQFSVLHRDRKNVRCIIIPSLAECRDHFATLFPKVTWAIPSSKLDPKHPRRSANTRGMQPIFREEVDDDPFDIDWDDWHLTNVPWLTEDDDDE